MWFIGVCSQVGFLCLAGFWAVCIVYSLVYKIALVYLTLGAICASVVYNMLCCMLNETCLSVHAQFVLIMPIENVEHTRPATLRTAATKLQQKFVSNASCCWLVRFNCMLCVRTVGWDWVIII